MSTCATADSSLEKETGTSFGKEVLGSVVSTKRNDLNIQYQQYQRDILTSLGVESLQTNWRTERIVLGHLDWEDVQSVLTLHTAHCSALFLTALTPNVRC